MSDRFIVIETVPGRAEADILCGFLQASGIECQISEAAARGMFGPGFGPLASVEILVPARQEQAARAALEDYHKAGAGESEEEGD
jgi:hypothetical protein